MLPFPELIFPVLSLAAVLFVVLSILVPGIFIWLGLKVVGRDRSVLRCALANIAALVVAFVVTVALSFTPLVIIFPIIYFLVYLYVLKVLLDISYLEALAATIIAGLIVGLIGFVLTLIFNVWVFSFLPKPIHGRFVNF